VTRGYRVDRSRAGKADAVPGGQRVYRALAALALLVCLPGAMLTASAAGNEVAAMQQVTDFRQEAEISRAHGLVMVLEFSSEDCTYCHKLEALFLLPMQRNSDYDDKILLRSLSLDEGNSVIDFDGRSITTGEFAARYGVSLTPTLLFLDAYGNELSERLVGIWSEDFYGGFIDNRIDQARQKL
jgi:thioredoxin-related protein